MIVFYKSEWIFVNVPFCDSLPFAMYLSWFLGATFLAFALLMYLQHFWSELISKTFSPLELCITS